MHDLQLSKHDNNVLKIIFYRTKAKRKRERCLQCQGHSRLSVKVTESKRGD